MNDLKFAFRQLLKNPGFTAVAVLTLALGIGANTAIFSIINGVVLRPLPYKDSEQLVLLWGANEKFGMSRMYISGPDFVEWRERQTAFEHIAAYRASGATISTGTAVDSVPGARVSASLFSMMKEQPLLGRVFTQAEEQPGRNQAALISYGLWQRRFGGDPAVVGSVIQVSDQPHTVIGVMPAGFGFPNECDLWTPVNLDLKEDYNSRKNFFYTVIGRLKPSVTLRQAQEEMNVLTAQLAQQFPGDYQGYRVWLQPLLDQVVGPTKPALDILFGAAMFVLLIACANVANLLLVRAAQREREFAIRAAIGAGRAKIVYQLLTESLLLAVLGGAGGVLIAKWGMEALPALSPWPIPRIEEVRLDFAVLRFALVVSVLTALLFGLAPAWRATRFNVNQALKEQGGAATASRSRQPFHAALVIGQIALAMTLLIGVALLLRSFYNLKQPRFGFEAENLLMARVSLPEDRYSQAVAIHTFVSDFSTRLRQVPQVRGVSHSNFMLYGGSSMAPIYIPGTTDDLPQHGLWMNRDSVEPNYFQNLKIPVLNGRVFTERDNEGGQKVAIIDETFARRFWPNENPIGRQFKIGRADSDSPWMTIVGVVGVIKENLFSDQMNGKFYVPFAQKPDRSVVFLIRGDSKPAELVPSVRALVKDALGEQTNVDIRTLEEALMAQFQFPGFVTKLLGIFAGMALVLATLGLYGLVAYSVTQRTREIGLRIALGAQKSQILTMILRGGMTVSAIGILTGGAAALGLTRFLKSLLIGIAPTDLLTFAGIAVVLALAALVASWLPARRAAKVDPMEALRCE